MRRRIAPAFIVAGLAAAPIAATQAETLDAPTRLQALLDEYCAEETVTARCEIELWDFADVSSDGDISAAEITRLVRIFAQKHGENQVAGTDMSPGETLLLSAMLAPMGAQLVISNFDYDGDGKLSRREIYHDLEEGSLREFMEEMGTAGKSAFSKALLMMLGAGMGAAALNNGPSTTD